MSLDQIISVSITRDTTTVSQVGFGTPLLVSYFPTSIFPERARTYTGLQGLLDDGFVVTDPVYRMASNLLAQNPSPSQFKVGRRVGAPQQVITLTPEASPVEGDVYTLVVTGVDDGALGSQVATSDSVSYTVIAADTPTDVCDGLRAALAALNAAAGQAGDFADAGTATLTITASNTHATVDGTLFGVVVSTNLEVSDDTPNPTVKIATDIGNINDYDNDWYGLLIDSNSALEITGSDVGAADWVAANASEWPRLFVCQTQDSEVASIAAASDTSSLAYTLQNANNDRVMLFFHRDPNDRVDAAMMGVALPNDPGSITWAYQQLASVSSQSLTANEMSNMMATIASPTGGKGVNTLTTLAGVAVTRYGTASGGEYFDVMRYSDYLAARIQERVYTVLASSPKIPYTDAGIQSVRSEILAQMEAGIPIGAVASDPPPTCEVPRAQDVSAADKSTRTLNNVTFRLTLASAVHFIGIEGQLTL